MFNKTLSFESYQFENFEKKARHIYFGASNREDLYTLLKAQYESCFPAHKENVVRDNVGCIINTVRNFDANCQKIKVDLTHLIHMFQEQTDDGKTPSEKAAFWKRFLLGLRCLNQEDQGDHDTEELLRKLREVSEGDITETGEADENKNLVCEELQQNDYLLRNFLLHMDKLASAGNAEEILEKLVHVSEENNAIACIISLLVYCDIKNGAFPVKRKYSIEQITCSVCKELMYYKVYREVYDKDTALYVMDLIFSVIDLIALFAGGLMLSELLFPPAAILYVLVWALVACTCISSFKETIELCAYFLRPLHLKIIKRIRYGPYPILTFLSKVSIETGD